MTRARREQTRVCVRARVRAQLLTLSTAKFLMLNRQPRAEREQTKPGRRKNSRNTQTNTPARPTAETEHADGVVDQLMTFNVHVPETRVQTHMCACKTQREQRSRHSPALTGLNFALTAREALRERLAHVLTLFVVERLRTVNKQQRRRIREEVEAL